MAGGSSGLAVRRVTEPTLLGRRWQVLMVMPWPFTRIRPWSMTYAGRACIWMSGVAMSGLLFTNMPASHTDAVIGPVLVVMYCSPASAALSGRSEVL